jgi:hypothetical protein
VRPAQDRQRFATSQLRALEVIDSRFMVANLIACAAKYAFQCAQVFEVNVSDSCDGFHGTAYYTPARRLSLKLPGAPRASPRASNDPWQIPWQAP